jgi:cell division protein FtsL
MRIVGVESVPIDEAIQRHLSCLVSANSVNLLLLVCLLFIAALLCYVYYYYVRDKSEADRKRAKKSE